MGHILNHNVKIFLYKISYNVKTLLYKIQNICKKYFQLSNVHLINMIHSNVEKTEKNRHDNSPTYNGDPMYK